MDYSAYKVGDRVEWVEDGVVYPGIVDAVVVNVDHSDPTDSLLTIKYVCDDQPCECTFGGHFHSSNTYWRLINPLEVL